MVVGGDGEVAAFKGGLVTLVAAFFIAAGGPVTFRGVKLVEGVLRADLVADGI